MLKEPPGVPGTNSPVNEAEVIDVWEPSTKSSAVSISVPGVPGRLAAAIAFVGVRLL
jgi:hypothetical protein